MIISEKLPEELQHGDTVTINGVICLTCEDVIVSRHRNGYVPCHCPVESDTWVRVEGGSDRRGRSHGVRARWIELSGEVICS